LDPSITPIDQLPNAPETTYWISADSGTVTSGMMVQVQPSGGEKDGKVELKTSDGKILTANVRSSKDADKVLDSKKASGEMIEIQLRSTSTNSSTTSIPANPCGTEIIVISGSLNKEVNSK